MRYINLHFTYLLTYLLTVDIQSATAEIRRGKRRRRRRKKKKRDKNIMSASAMQGGHNNTVRTLELCLKLYVRLGIGTSRSPE